MAQPALYILAGPNGAGYTIDLTYVCLGSPYLNLARVAMRVSAGGHHVPDKDVFRRYSRSLRNLPAAVALAERARVFDNTKGSKPRMVFERRERRILFLHTKWPDWFMTAFGMENTIADPIQYIEERLRQFRADQK